ncbi:hypothetical protein Tco_0540726, partial [Tanacetum coccineum]
RVAESLIATLPDLISEILKLAIPKIITESVKQTVKPMNKQFNAFNKLESSREASISVQDIPTLVVHTPEEKASKDKAIEEEPPSKRLKTTSSSEYFPTPPRDENKGKGIDTKEEPMKLLMPLIEQGESDPKMLNLHQFSISGKKMTLEDAQAQLTEMKRLVDLKVDQEKSEKKLKKLSPAKIQAQAQKLAEFEAKRKKMLDE